MTHSELMNEAEALAYLHLTPDDAHCLKTLRVQHGLHSAQIGRNTMYLKSDLDRIIERIFGRSLPCSEREVNYGSHEQTDSPNSLRPPRRKKLDQHMV